jgi:hypothetical protein
VNPAAEEQTVEEPTCGRGLAQSAVVPEALAAVAAGVAQNLEVHMRALHPDDDAAVQERRVYERVAHGLRGAAADLRATAAEMTAAVDLPMGEHDVTAVTAAEILDAFQGLVAAEDALRRLLEARRGDHEQLLTAIRGETGGPGAGRP